MNTEQYNSEDKKEEGHFGCPLLANRLNSAEKAQGRNGSPGVGEHEKIDGSFRAFFGKSI